MFGKDIIYKCPYCGKIIVSDIGVTTYYSYEDKVGIIERHCGKNFLTPDYGLNVNLIRYDQEALYRQTRMFPQHILKTMLSVYDEKDDEDSIINKTIQELLSVNENADINALKTICQIIIGQGNLDFNSMWSLKLEDIDTSKIKAERTICW